MTKQTKKPADPAIEAQIKRALAKYEGKATPAMLQVMRDQLEELLTTHPVGVGLMEQVRQRPAMLVSGEVAREGAAKDDKAGGGKDGA